nr:hypothetical protein [Tanacetum cinerariifolium]
ALVDGKKVIVNEASIRRDLRLDDAECTACLPNAAIFEELARMGAKTTSWNEFSSTMASRKNKSRRKQRKGTEVSQDEPPTKEHIPTPSHDPLSNGEDRLQLNALIEICKKLSDRVLSLEQVKTNQAAEVEKLKKRVKKIKGMKKKRTHKLNRLYKGRSITDIDQDEGTTLVDDTQGRMNDHDMFGVNDLDDDEIVVYVSAGEKEEQSEKLAEREVSTIDAVTTAGEVVTIADVEVSAALTTTTTKDDELTLAQTLIEIKAAKPSRLCAQAQSGDNMPFHKQAFMEYLRWFWNTIVVKRSGDVTRLQALVDKRKIVISEDVIREILRLDDTEAVVCLPNEEIFAGLAQMGYEKPAKRTSWNEFSTAMTSAAICLSKGQRFNFSRVGKGCSGVETPLFENMLEVREIADDVAQPTLPLPPSPVIPSSPPHQSPRPSPSQAAEGSSLLVQQVLDKCSALVLRIKGLETANTAQQLEIIKLKARVKKLERFNKVKSSKLRRLKKVGTSQSIESSEDEENVFNQGRISVDIDEGIKLFVLAAKPTVVAVSTLISAAKPTAKPKVLKIVPAAPAEEEESHVQAKDVQAKDVQAKGIQYIRRYHGYKKKPQSEYEAHKNMLAYLKNTEVKRRDRERRRGDHQEHK